MELSEGDRATKAINALVETLEGLPHVTVSHVEAEPGFGRHQCLDAAVEADVAGKGIVLIVECKSVVYPRDVREAIWRLLAAKKDAEAKRVETVVPVLAASSISVGARQLLREEGVGYFDDGGSLFVPAPGAYLDIERPVPKSGERTIGSLFTGKRSQILHALVLDHGDWFGVSELAERAKVSFGTASETLSALERLEWVSARGHGPNKERRLSDTTSLLDSWARHVEEGPRYKRRRFYVPGKGADTIATKLEAECEALGAEYVLTLDRAAQEYSPYLTSINRIACRMAPSEKTDIVLEHLDVRAVTEGANLDVIETPSRTEFLFKEKRAGLWLASPLQVYLDLLRGEGRSRDMAEHLRKEVLGV